MDEQFTDGDVVELKSGGPRMTIAGVVQQEGQKTLKCDWFDGAIVRSGQFPEISFKRPDY